MQPRRVLVVGRSPEMMARVLQMLGSAGYEAQGFLELEKALQGMAEGRYDALVIGGGVEPAPRRQLKESFQRLHPQGRVYEHSMGGATPLLEGLAQVLAGPSPTK